MTHPNEVRRLDALQRAALHDALTEEELNFLAGLAARACSTPWAFVTLVDDSRKWFKAVSGDFPFERSLPRDGAFCCRVVQEGSLVEIGDTLDCGVHREHPLVVGEPHIRFFAGAPLLDDNHLAMGSLCVAAPRPGALDAEQRTQLTRLAQHIMGLIQLRRAAVNSDEHANRRQLATHGEDQRFYSLADQLHGMVYRCRNDAEWTMDYVSPGCRRLLGRDPAELLAGHPTYGSLIHPQDAGRVWEAVQSALAAHQPFQIEYRVRHVDGDWRWVFEQGAGVWAASGEVQFLEGYCTDITAKILAERARDEAVLDLQSAVQAIPDLLFEMDADGRYIRVLAGPRELLAAPSASIIGHSVAESLPPEAVAQIMDALREAAATGESRGQQFCLELPQGTRWFELSTARKPGHASPARLIMLSRDITSRKQAEEAAAERERFARSSLDALDAHIAVLDADARIIATNESWRVFAAENGAAPAQVSEGANYLAACDRAASSEDECASAACQIATAIRDVVAGRIAHAPPLEYSCHSPSEERWFHCRVSRFPGDGLLRVVVAHEDVTEAHQATQKLKSALATFTSLARIAPAGIFQTDPLGDPVFFNTRWSEITGQAAELDGHWTSVVHPDDLRRVVSDWSRAVRAQSPFNANFRVRRPDRRAVFVACDAMPTRAPDGGVDGYIGVITDITPHIETNQILAMLSGELAKLNGTAFHAAVARQLARLTESEVAFVSGWRAATPDHAHTLALSLHDRIEEDAVFSVVGSPIEQALRTGKMFVVPGEARRLFPRDAFIAEKGIEALAVMPLFDSAGETSGHICVMATRVFADADRVRQVLALFSAPVAAEIERERTELRFQSLFESSPDAILVADMGGTITTVNRRCAVLFGYRNEELIGQPVELLVPESIRSHHVRLREGFAAGSAPTAMASNRPPVTGRRKDGSLVPIEVVLHGFELGGGPVVVATARDVSGRLRMEREAHEAHASLDAIDDGALILDAETLTISYANQGATRELGYAREELIGSKPWNIGIDHHEAEYRSVIEAPRGSPTESHRYESNYRRKDGSRLPVEGTLQAVRLPDGAVRCVLIFRDNRERLDTLRRLEAAAVELAAANAAVKLERSLLAKRVDERTTELKAANEELVRARNAAEAANRAKSAFLAAMSHEIRTPMNGVIGTAEVLERSELSPWQASLVETIRDSGVSLLGVINDILDFSKIESATVELEAEAFSPAQCVEAVCDSLREMARSAGVELLLFTDPALFATSIGDRMRLRQVLINLVGNAIKFSAGAQRPGCVRVRAETDGPARWTASVTDNGIGIPADALTRIFEPFVQADGSTTRRFGGTGLGLSICKGLVTAMDGSITVRSRPSEGATFTVTLPRQVAAAPAVDLPVPDLRGLACEIRTEDLDLRHTWRRYLEHAGGRVAGTPATLHGEARAAVLVVVDLGCENVDESRARDATAQGAGVLYVQRGARHGAPGEPEPEPAVFIDGQAMRMHAFLQAGAQAVGRALPDTPDTHRVVPRSEAFEPPVVQPGRGRILVAEDNPVNRRVLGLQLEQLGLSADFVSNGREALERWRTGAYALLLTDLAMPEMDGFALAQAVRTAETPGHRSPIIAVTANALLSEQRRCLAAGMDAYLTKPTRLQTLRDTLVPLLERKPRQSPDGTAPAGMATETEGAAMDPAATAQPAIDLDALRALVGDDPQVIDDLLVQFLSSARSDASTIRETVPALGSAPIADAAHRLKSSSRAIGAARLTELCEKMERTGRASDVRSITALLPLFEVSFQEVMAAIEHARSF